MLRTDWVEKSRGEDKMRGLLPEKPSAALIYRLAPFYLFLRTARGAILNSFTEMRARWV